MRRPQCGPYGEIWQDASGKWHKRLTDEGRRIAEEFLLKFPEPGKLLRRAFRGLYRATQQFGMTHDELNELCMDATVIGVIRYDPTRADTVSTCVAWSCRSVVVDELRRRTRRNREHCISQICDKWEKQGDNPYYSAPAREEKDRRDDGEEIASLIVAADLDHRQTALMVRRCGFMGREESFCEIASDLGVSKERVRQIHSIALNRLRMAAGVDCRTRDRVLSMLRSGPKSWRGMIVKTGVPSQLLGEVLDDLVQERVVERCGRAAVKSDDKYRLVEASRACA